MKDLKKARAIVQLAHEAVKKYQQILDLSSGHGVCRDPHLVVEYKNKLLLLKEIMEEQNSIIDRIQLKESLK